MLTRRTLLGSAAVAAGAALLPSKPTSALPVSAEPPPGVIPCKDPLCDICAGYWRAPDIRPGDVVETTAAFREWNNDNPRWTSPMTVNVLMPYRPGWSHTSQLVYAQWFDAEGLQEAFLDIMSVQHVPLPYEHLDLLHHYHPAHVRHKQCHVVQTELTMHFRCSCGVTLTITPWAVAMRDNQMFAGYGQVSGLPNEGCQEIPG